MIKGKKFSQATVLLDHQIAFLTMELRTYSYPNLLLRLIIKVVFAAIYDTAPSCMLRTVLTASRDYLYGFSKSNISAPTPTDAFLSLEIEGSIITKHGKLKTL